MAVDVRLERPKNAAEVHLAFFCLHAKMRSLVQVYRARGLDALAQSLAENGASWDRGNEGMGPLMSLAHRMFPELLEGDVEVERDYAKGEVRIGFAFDFERGSSHPSDFVAPELARIELDWDSGAMELSPFADDIDDEYDVAVDRYDEDRSSMKESA